VHALYGFARWADDIVDDTASALTTAQRRARLAELERRVEQGLRAGSSPHPVLAALCHTAAVHGIDHRHFADFLRSMRSDLEVTDYPTYADLHRYMHGSAAVIGLQLLPVLGTVVPPREAAPHAAALGVAFQLTNFIRDVGEDLDRGRVYLPADLLAAHGVDRALLHWSRRTGRPDPRVAGALAEAAALTRRVYREAVPGLAMLDPASRPCVRTACVLYGAILETVERDGYAVLHRRAVVPRRRRATVALDGAVRIASGRLRARSGTRATRGARQGAR
jgi:phytoene synthase